MFGIIGQKTNVENISEAGPQEIVAQLNVRLRKTTIIINFINFGDFYEKF